MAGSMSKISEPPRSPRLFPLSVTIAVDALNRMLELGRPEYGRVA